MQLGNEPSSTPERLAIRDDAQIIKSHMSKQDCEHPAKTTQTGGYFVRFAWSTLESFLIFGDRGRMGTLNPVIICGGTRPSPRNYSKSAFLRSSYQRLRFHPSVDSCERRR